MRYTLLFLLLIAGTSFAQPEGIKTLRVACGGGVVIRVFENPTASDLELADKLAQNATCARDGKAWVEKNYWYRVKTTAGSSSASSKASSAPSSVKSSAAASSISVPANQVGVQFQKPYSLYPIKQYWLLRMKNGVATNEKFTSNEIEIVHFTAPPASGETFFVAAENTKNIYSTFVPVEM